MLESGRDSLGEALESLPVKAGQLVGLGVEETSLVDGLDDGFAEALPDAVVLIRVKIPAAEAACGPRRLRLAVVALEREELAAGDHAEVEGAARGDDGTDLEP